MDDNLEESLNLDESIGVDFEVEGNTIIVADTNTDLTTSQEDVPMEFDTIQEPVIMETEGEEITVSEFMGEQFVLNSEYEVHDEGNASLSLESGIDGNTIVESVASSSNPNSLLKDNAVDFHFEEEPLVETMVTSLQQPSTITTSNAAQPTVFRIQRPREKATIPRPVPIAPKPQNRPAANYSIVKPVPIAPKQTATAAKTVPGFTKIQFISQVGKQVIMLPASNKRFKMVHSAGGIQYINDKESKEATTTPTTAKPLKFIVKGTKPELAQQQPKLVTKVVNTKLPEARFVCVNKNVPVSTKMITIPIQIKSKSVLSTNSSQKFVQVTPSNVVSLKSPTKVIPATTMSTTVQNKAVILPKASPVRNVILKTVRKKPQQMQYFRLATEQPAESSETENKTIMVTYNKEKLATSSAPPPLVVTSGKVNRKFKKSTITIPAAGKKIVTRSPQSLLAPIVPTPPEPVQSQAAPPDLEDKKDPELSQQDILIDSKEEVKKSLLKDNMDVRKVSSQPSELSWSIEEEQLDDSYRVCVIDPDSYSKNQSFSEPECNPNISSNDPPTPTDAVLNSRPRKACNCNKSQCLKLYCECFANGEFCKDCNCVNCHNNLVNDDARRAAIMGCLERNPDAFRPKIGKARSTEGPATVRRHNKGCNCKRSGCLKNYCECYEAKIACTPICKCVGCRNVEDGGERNRKTCVARVPRIIPRKEKQPCRLLTTSVIEAAVQCLLAAAVPPDGVPVGAGGAGGAPPHDAVRAVLTEYARCLHAVMSAARHAQAIT